MNAVESSAGAETEQPDVEQSAPGLESLGELLAADEPSDNTTAGADEQGQRGSDDTALPTRFNDLAGRLDIDLDALYKLEVTTSEDGEPVTIEALKDAYTGKAQTDLERIEFEEYRAEQQKELLRANQELQEILASLPSNAVKPEVLERIRAKRETVMQVEREKTLQVIPEWKNEEARTAEIAAMAEHLKGYGFPPEYLAGVTSHQHFKYIRDNWLREQRMQKALAAVRAGKPDKRPSSTGTKPAPKKSPIPSKRGAHPNRLAAVFSSID